jgi:hypothetical protein
MDEAFGSPLKRRGHNAPSHRMVPFKVLGGDIVILRFEVVIRWSTVLTIGEPRILTRFLRRFYGEPKRTTPNIKRDQSLY